MPNQTPPNNRTLEVTIRSRQKVVYEGEAFYIKSVNEKGDFAILGEHTNFISIIKDHLIIGKIDNTTEKIDLTEQAVLKINKNIVEVYLGISQNKQPNSSTSSPSESKPEAGK